MVKKITGDHPLHIYNRAGKCLVAFFQKFSAKSLRNSRSRAGTRVPGSLGCEMDFEFSKPTAASDYR